MSTRHLFFRIIYMRYNEESRKEKAMNNSLYYARDLSESSDPYLLFEIQEGLDDVIRTWIRCLEDYFNDLLRVNGYVFLDQVYKKMKLECLPIDLLVGWRRGSEQGDGFVDLRFQVIERPDGSKRYVIDPNVDGLLTMPD